MLHQAKSPGPHTHEQQGVVLVLSLGIRYRNKKRIKKHSKKQTADRAESGEMTQPASQAEEFRVPFGIRAIERGGEVNGVWNSRTNTPLQTLGNSNPGSPTARPKDFGNGLLSLQQRRREISSSTVSNVETAELANARPDPKTSPDNSAETATEVSLAVAAKDTAESSEGHELPMRGRRAYQPKGSPGKVSYPPSSYAPTRRSRRRSYPPSAYQPLGVAKHKSYPSSLSHASTSASTSTLSTGK